MSFQSSSAHSSGCPLPLLPHQCEAREFIDEKKRVLLALPAGAGKTLTVLDVLLHLDPSDRRPCLILSPAPLVSVWSSEWKKWGMDRLTCRKMYVHSGEKRKREERLKDLLRHGGTGHGTEENGSWYGNLVVVMGYELFLREAEFWRPLPWRVVTLDESGKIRNPTAKITKEILKVDSEYKLALDGTPISNTIADLWAPCTWLEKNVLLGNWWKFRAHYAVMNPYIPGKIDGWRNTDEIKSRAAPLILWKKKEDILPDLPEMREQTIEFEMGEKEMAHYKKIKNELIVELSGEEVPLANALVKLLRLRQATFGRDLFDGTSGSTKFETALTLLEELRPGDKIVIFSMFETAVDLLAEKLKENPKFWVEKITGSSSKVAREEAESRFMADREAHVSILLGTGAIERGLNLQKASYLMNLDLPWSYASYDQRVGRIWRQGQKNKTLVWNLSAKGTVDAYMQEVLLKKTKLGEEVRQVTMQDVQNILSLPF